MTAPAADTSAGGAVASVAALAGKVVVVLGGTGGIGSAVASEALSAGGHVVVVGRRPAAVAAEVGRLEVALDRGAQVRGAVHDLVTGEPDALVAQLFDVVDGVDVLVSAASAPASYGPLTDLDLDDVARAFAVKVVGALRVVQALVPHLRGDADDPGAVVLIAGNAARDPGTTNLQTAVVNAATVTAARSLAVQLAPAVRAVAVSPGPTRTARFEALTAELGGGNGAAAAWPKLLRGRPALPAEVAELVVALCGPAGRLVNGTEVIADGGWA